MILLLSSCANTIGLETVYKEKKEDYVYRRGSFVTQILTFHPDHKHMLTNRDDVNIKEYDLRNSEIRDTLDRLYFSCVIGNKHYFICQDVAGICRKTDECLEWKKKFLKKKECVKKKIEVITTESHDFLVKSGVHCYSEITYPRGI